MAEPQITARDHLLAATLTALVATRFADSREAMWRAILAEVLPLVTRSHRRVAALAGAAELLLRAGTPAERCRADLEAAAAVQGWAAWRVGLAQEAIGKGGKA